MSNCSLYFQPNKIIVINKFFLKMFFFLHFLLNCRALIRLANLNILSFGFFFFSIFASLYNLFRQFVFCFCPASQKKNGPQKIWTGKINVHVFFCCCWISVCVFNLFYILMIEMCLNSIERNWIFLFFLFSFGCIVLWIYVEWFNCRNELMRSCIIYFFCRKLFWAIR